MARLIPNENDLATVRPDLAVEWHPVRNGELRPTAVTCGSNRKVWWRCSKGHKWQAVVSGRAAGRNCPVCYLGHVPVVCVETGDEYPSYHRAAMAVGLKGWAGIKIACNDPEKTAAGYHWSYKGTVPKDGADGRLSL